MEMAKREVTHQDLTTITHDANTFGKATEPTLAKKKHGVTERFLGP